MSSKVDILSLAISKTRQDDFQFIKYDIEVALEEVESTELSCSLKYSLTLLSQPKNIRISVEGTTKITGKEDERTKAMMPDENNIPSVLHEIYDELFPVFFMITKSMQIPCPAYKLATIKKPTETTSQVTEPTEKIAKEIGPQETQQKDLIENPVLNQ